MIKFDPSPIFGVYCVWVSVWKVSKFEKKLGTKFRFSLKSVCLEFKVYPSSNGYIKR